MPRLLVIEDNDTERQSIVELLGHDDIEITTVATGEEAYEALLDRAFDCCVLDLRLPDMSGFDLLERIHGDSSLCNVPVVVFTGKDLSDEEEARLRTMAKSIVLKDVQSPERLLDETALVRFFPHRKPRARCAPRFHHFMIGPRGRTDEIEQIEDEWFEVRHYTLVDDTDHLK